MKSMKYIRTKNGVYEKEQIIEIYDDEGNVLATYSIDVSSTYKDIIAQANTIEELCDAYVIVPKDKKYKPLIEISLSVFDDFEDVLKHNDIYLSIWIDALLKPVAKLNDKGEPKLL